MNTTDRKPPDRPFELDDFQNLPVDRGLSLDELTRAYADLLGRGEDPYGELPSDEPVVELDDEAADETPDEGEEPVAAAAEAPEAVEITPRSILEAMLFVGHPDNKPLTSERVASLMRGVRPQEIDELVIELNEDYERQGCPYCVESVGAGYRMALREEFGSLRNNFYGKVKAAKLSQAAVDVLAIVAYKQPMTREQVDQLRGKPSGGLLSQLVRRELLRIERTETKPRLTHFYTTARFLQLFGMESLEDLPNSPD
ncbi:MAG: SMC-Scp complex subunit ScpB [Pirellulaceae bacterium]|nr:SMC-Scp complex subunit ScpB [Pirellulaceae bacterium]